MDTLSVPTQEEIAEREALGIDRFDEVWDGVYVMVPPPASLHQRLECLLQPVLKPLAEARGLEVIHETGMFGEAGLRNFRVPDLCVAPPAVISERGIERGATLAIEILSRRWYDLAKLPFYAHCGVREVWLLGQASRSIEVFVLENGAYVPSPPDARGCIAAPALGLELSVAAGPKLRLAWAGGDAEI
jgi:hypothetical protein